MGSPCDAVVDVFWFVVVQGPSSHRQYTSKLRSALIKRRKATSSSNSCASLVLAIMTLTSLMPRIVVQEEKKKCHLSLSPWGSDGSSGASGLCVIYCFRGQSAHCSPYVRSSGHGGLESRECPVWSGDLPFNNLLKPGKDGVGNGEVRPQLALPERIANGENAATPVIRSA